MPGQRTRLTDPSVNVRPFPLRLTLTDSSVRRLRSLDRRIRRRTDLCAASPSERGPTVSLDLIALLASPERHPLERGARMQLGMIGLGRMGANLVRRLLAAGHDAVVYDLDAAAVAELSEQGATGTS